MRDTPFSKRAPAHARTHAPTPKLQLWRGLGKGWGWGSARELAARQLARRLSGRAPLQPPPPSPSTPTHPRAYLLAIWGLKRVGTGHRQQESSEHRQQLIACLAACSSTPEASSSTMPPPPPPPPHKGMRGRALTADAVEEQVQIEVDLGIDHCACGCQGSSSRQPRRTPSSAPRRPSCVFADGRSKKGGGGREMWRAGREGKV